MLLDVTLGAIAGLLAGSFIATLALRTARGESAFGGRSRCDHCGTPIAFASLVPLLSFALQRGYARCCGSRIALIHPLTEAAAALIGGSSALLPWPWPIASAWLGWLLLALGLIDLKTFRLPNGLVFLLGISGIAAARLLSSPTLLDSLVGTGVGFAFLEALRLIYFYARGRDGIGRGDPKMFGAIGAWTGWALLPQVLLLAALAGIGWAGFRRLAGYRLEWTDRLPLGTLLGLAAWPVWLWALFRAAQ